MANHANTRKRMRQDVKRRIRNRSARSRLRTAVKKVRVAAEAGQHDEARAALPTAVSLLDSTASKGIIHPNAAARTKSRLVKLVAGLD